MSRTADADARIATANEIAALLRSQYVTSGDRAYLHAAAIALSRVTAEPSRKPEAVPAH